MSLLSTACGTHSYLSFCKATGQSHIFPPPISMPSITSTGKLSSNMTSEQNIKHKWHLHLNHVTTVKSINGLLLVVSPASPPSLSLLILYAPPANLATVKALPQVTSQFDPSRSPGAGVSTDQMEATALGLLPTNKGQPTSHQYLYCNFWIDLFLPSSVSPVILIL